MRGYWQTSSLVARFGWPSKQASRRNLRRAGSWIIIYYFRAAAKLHGAIFSPIKLADGREDLTPTPRHCRRRDGERPVGHFAPPIQRLVIIVLIDIKNGAGLIEPFRPRHVDATHDDERHILPEFRFAIGIFHYLH